MWARATDYTLAVAIVFLQERMAARLLREPRGTARSTQ
jgi:hypothetical protein